MIQRIKKSVTHQGIGGKEFRVDEYVTKTLTPAEVSEKGIKEGNPACWNFMDRREDFDLNFPRKLYYVKIDNIGYIIAEDEIDTEIESNDISFKDGIGFDPGDTNWPEGGAGASAMAIATPKLKHEFDPIKEQLEKDIFNNALSPNDIIKAINDTIPLSVQAQMMRGGGK